jgi:SAM-dependent methyltransferase
MSAAALIRACPVGCEAPLAPTDIVLPEGALLACAECGQLVSQVSEEDYRRGMLRYDAADFNRPEGAERERRLAVARRRLLEIARRLDSAPARLRLLDVGCSRGHFLEAARALGFAAEGVEPAAGVAAEARAAGLEVHTGRLEEQRFPDGRFDAVTLFEVIEHLPEPRPLLAECRRILRPGGILLLSTGNAASWTARAMGARWDYFRLERDPGHVSFYNPRSIALLARRCGFELEAVRTARVRFHERGEVSAPRYALGKALAELLNVPARLLGRGHDLLAWLRRSAS